MEFLGGIFWEDFFGRISWEDFFGRNYLVVFFTRNCCFFQDFGVILSKWKEEGRRILDPYKCDASSSHLTINILHMCPFDG